MTKSTNGSLQARFLYDGQLRVVSELNSSNEITKVYLYGDSPNAPEAMVIGDTNYLFVKDQRGSIRQVVNSETGVVEQEMSYDDWGHVTSDSNPGFQPFGFAGGLYDYETGLVRFGARDYDASVGRWLSKDPIRFDGGDTNLYGYVLQDPVNLIDPVGKNPAVFIGATIGAIILTQADSQGFLPCDFRILNPCTPDKQLIEEINDTINNPDGSEPPTGEDNQCPVVTRKDKRFLKVYPSPLPTKGGGLLQPIASLFHS